MVLLRSLRVVSLSLALPLVVTACKKAPPAAESTAVATAEPKKETPPAAVPEDVRKLFGRWLRSDGGYTLEIRSADISGSLDAGYFNPKSIHVSRAIWMRGGQGLQIVVELNDVGYPGATYVLTHDAQADRLVGQYTQPSLQQTFDIDFVRQAKP